jgi:hypothetical protein
MIPQFVWGWHGNKKHRSTYNINERMQPNQFWGCTIVALGTLTPEVIKNN